MRETHDVTRLLERQADGDPAAMHALVDRVYGELCAVARRQMRRERPGHTLDTRALVNEAYLELANLDRYGWKNRNHFFGVAGLAMKRILVQHARAKRAHKRGGNAEKLDLEVLDFEIVEDHQAETILQVNEALEKLDAIDSRARRVVELRIFVGLANEEIATVLDISKATVKRDWTFARAWLNRTLTIDADGHDGLDGLASGRGGAAPQST